MTVSRFTSHLADDRNPAETLCGLSWEFWQDPDQGASLQEAVDAVPTLTEKAEVRAADAARRPQTGERIEQCRACFKAVKKEVNKHP